MTEDNVHQEKTLRILVVDDEPGIREVLQAFLEKEGYDVTTADGGVSALSKLEEPCPHIILLDIRMDDMDGIQCLRVIKDRNPRIEVIVISGFATLQMARKALEIGAFDYICKPLSFPHLREVIQQIKNTKFLEFM